MGDSHAADFAGNISRERAENAFRDALRLFVGRGRKHKASDVALASGVPLRLIDCYRGYPLGHVDHRPLHFGHKMSLSAYLGAEFTSVWLGVAEQAAYDLPDGEDDLDTAALDAGEVSHAVQRARHPASPGGVAIVPQERAEIIPLLRKTAASARRAIA